jgi:UDP-glucuronate 4-epimerase
MNILVTGGAGFIGSHLCGVLLSQGNKVICVDNFNDYYSPECKEKNIKSYINHPFFKLYKADILNLQVMKEIFSEELPHKVVHLAARAGVRPSIQEPLLYEEVNIKGTLNMLELVREFDIKNFVFASSSSVYGNNKKVPFSESDNVDNPISPYAATKKAGELLCYTYYHLYNLNISCLRFFTVYGPRGRPDMAHLKFARLINRGKEIEIYGTGDSERDYTYVTDIVAGILAVLERESGYEIFNLGNSNPTKLSYLIELLGKELGKEVKLRYVKKQAGDVERTFANLSKSKQVLGYNPQVNIEKGVKLFIEWFKLSVYYDRKN